MAGRSFYQIKSMSGSLALLLLLIFNLTINKCSANGLDSPVCNCEEWRQQFWKLTSKEKAEAGVFEAAKSGDTAETRWLLELGTNVNALDVNGSTPLHMAAEHDQAEVIQTLLDRNASLNAKNNISWTPLHYSAKYNQVRACTVLAKAGASIDAQEVSGFTPLHVAAINSRLEVSKCLLDNGANPNIRDTFTQWTPLFYSAYVGNLPLTTLLVERGADVNARVDYEKLKGTPLLFAYNLGHTAVVDYLKSKGGLY